MKEQPELYYCKKYIDDYYWNHYICPSGFRDRERK